MVKLQLSTTSMCNQPNKAGALYGNPLENSQAIQDDLQVIHKWTCDWLMPLNNSKCFVLQLGKNNPNTNYIIENHSLKTVHEINDLGVLIDKELKIFTNPNGDLMKKLFVSYVRPIMEYASVIWSPYFIKDKQLLEKVQRRYTKTVENLKSILRYLPSTRTLLNEGIVVTEKAAIMCSL
ncbi:uncharacterized protein LOC135125670 [Zophobas morio]|uniref:uncharacterized protein LOC135125670 n=1 Tax=Zophobas morio TaxID=2755281 RepID=UPI003082F46C